MRLDAPKAAALAAAAALVATMLMPWTASAQSTFESLRYNERGQLTEQQMNGAATNLRYDRMDRLVEQGSPSLPAGATRRYVLDTDGNRLADNRSTYTIQPGAQRLAARDGAPLVHGPAGHLLADRGWVDNRWMQRNFSWNTAGQLKAVTIDGIPVASYLYNDAGQRTRKTRAAAPAGVPAVTLYRYDPQGQMVLEVAGAAVQAPGVVVAPGQVLVRYIWQDNIPVAVIWPPMTPGNPGASNERLVHLIVDHLNTPRRALDAQGVVVWQWRGEAFGADLPDEDVDRDGRRTVINLRFPGQYFDAESRLHYNWHRYYDPQVGRYIQSDPIGLEGGINTYAYAGGNPISFVDPTGLICIYSQSSGAMSCTDASGQNYYHATGYAGTGMGRNNPDAQGQGSVGPLPRGDWQVTGDWYNSPNTGRNTIRLRPMPGNDCQVTGRDCNSFRIHGNNAINDASHGCIVLPPSRTTIPSGEVIRVIP